MVSSLSFHSIATVNPSYSGDAGRSIFRPNRRFEVTGVSCRGQNPTNEPQITKGPEPENLLLKVAWYGSELLGIAASVFRSPASPPSMTGFEVPIDCSGRAVRVAVVDSIKQDFKRSYFVTGQWKKTIRISNCGFCFFYYLNRNLTFQGTWRRRFMRRSANSPIRLVLSKVLLVSKGIALILEV